MPNRATINTKEYRVEISPHFDLWMRGAQFGTVKREYLNAAGELMVVVKMDHPQVRRLFRCLAKDVKVL